MGTCMTAPVWSGQRAATARAAARAWTLARAWLVDARAIPVGAATAGEASQDALDPPITALNGAPGPEK